MFAGLLVAATLVAEGPWQFEAVGWTPKADEWKGWGQKIELSVTDWSAYDRLCVDLVNEGPGGDLLYLWLGSPGTPSGERRPYHTKTPDHRFKRWVVPLDGFKPTVSISNVTTVSFSSRRGKNQRLHLANIRLLRKGEPSGGGTFTEAPADTCDALRALTARTVAAEDAARSRRHADSLARFAADCARAGTARQGVLFGQASSMTRVFPRDAFAARPATNLHVRLARRETEAVQLLVAPTEGDLKGVKVTVSDLWNGDVRFAATNVAAHALGYVEMKIMPDYTHWSTQVTPSNTLVRVSRPPVLGWYPDPILDFLGAVDVAKGDVQGFWLSVRCPVGQPAGTYRGTVEVAGERFPLTVRVNDFTLPAVAPVPMNIAFKPGWRDPMLSVDGIRSETYEQGERRIRENRDCAAYLARQQTHAWAQFLADRLITIDYLYPSVGPRWDELVQLKREGRLGAFNLAYWNQNVKDDWFKLPRERYAKAKELGLLDHAVFYGMDEIPPERFGAAADVVARFKREFPDVPLVTTCKDKSYGCDSALSGIDVFIPVNEVYNPTNAARARAEGRKVGWYNCGGADVSVAQFFLGRSPIESRMMMGAPAAKYGPEWFLYYEICQWSSRDPITRGPFTDWSPETWVNWSGDGSLTACGPGGRPLSTVRLENFRDGLEDYHYAKILRARGGTVTVPESLVTSLRAFSDDPDAYQAWRDALADEIERRPPR